MSLLALAAGAAAIPASVQADIIFTDLSGSPQTVGATASPLFVLDNLPGAARLGFIAKAKSTAVTSVRWVTAGQQAGYVRLKTNASFAIPNAAGVRWDQVAGNSAASGTVGKANYSGHTPGSFDHKYVIFKFQDTSQPGNPLRYGWVDVSLSNPANNSGPDVTIFGYAYDNTGAFIVTGAVPEPAPVALAALGALVLGAKGLRQWRQKRPAQSAA
jgi:hypothetical protein